MSLYSFNEVVKHEPREINYYKYLKLHCKIAKLWQIFFYSIFNINLKICISLKKG